GSSLRQRIDQGLADHRVGGFVRIALAEVDHVDSGGQESPPLFLEPRERVGGHLGQHRVDHQQNLASLPKGVSGKHAYSPGVPTVTLASGLTLSYVRRGDGVDPPVLLLPGPTDSWRSYQPVLDHLPRETDVISVSQRGHGESDKPDSGYGIQDFAADAVML